MKDPAFLFYSSDFLTGTMFMSYEDKGKYITLMCLQHQQGHLTKEEMLNICGENNSKIFNKFLQDDEGNFYNERLEIETNKRKLYTESRRKNLNKSSHMDTHMESHMDEHMENENININKDIYINNNISEKKEEKTVKANKHKYGKYENVLLKDEELQKLQEEYQNWEELINYLDEYIEMKGYKAKSHYLCIKKWVIEAVQRKQVERKPIYTKPINIATNMHKEREYNEDFLNQFYANKGGS